MVKAVPAAFPPFVGAVGVISTVTLLSIAITTNSLSPYDEVTVGQDPVGAFGGKDTTKYSGAAGMLS